MNDPSPTTVPLSPSIAQPKPIKNISPLDIPVIYKESIKFFSCKLGPRRLELFSEEHKSADLKTLLNQKEAKTVIVSKSFFIPAKVSNKAALAKEKSKKFGLTFGRSTLESDKSLPTASTNQESADVSQSSTSSSRFRSSSPEYISFTKQPVSGELKHNESSQMEDKETKIIGPSSLKRLPSEVEEEPRYSEEIDKQLTPPLPIDRGDSNEWRRGLMSNHWPSQPVNVFKSGTSISTVLELESLEDLSEVEDRSTPRANAN